MNYDAYINYNFSYFPTKFAQDHLIVADGMAYMAHPDFYYNRKTFNNNLVLMVVKGTFYVEQYNKKYTLKSGQGILMKLTDHHKYYTDSVDTAHIIWFHFRGNMITPLLTLLQNYECLPILFQNDDYVKDNIYHCFELTNQQQPDFEYALSSHIYQTVLHIARPSLEHISTLDSSEVSWFTEQVSDYIHNHIYEKITLEHLCAHFHMNKFYFIRKFKQIYNTTPMQYIIIFKLRFSMKLLREPDYSINMIAHSLGFSDLAHFSRTFKKQFGISPSNYQKHCQQEQLMNFAAINTTSEEKHQPTK